MSYSSPRITELGNLRELTLSGNPFNKVGTTQDVLSGIPINGQGDTVIGSFTGVGFR